MGHQTPGIVSSFSKTLLPFFPKCTVSCCSAPTPPLPLPPEVVGSCWVWGGAFCPSGVLEPQAQNILFHKSLFKVLALLSLPEIHPTRFVHMNSCSFFKSWFGFYLLCKDFLAFLRQTFFSTHPYPSFILVTFYKCLSLSLAFPVRCMFFQVEVRS